MPNIRDAIRQWYGFDIKTHTRTKVDLAVPISTATTQELASDSLRLGLFVANLNQANAIYISFGIATTAADFIAIPANSSRYFSFLDSFDLVEQTVWASSGNALGIASFIELISDD